MKSIKVLIGDPGKTTDPFGVVGLEGIHPIIHIRHAKQFKGTPYGVVANHFEKLHKKINFDLLLLEKNFDYDNVSKAFSHLPITYVTTSSHLTESTRAKGWSVDKPFMIDWINQAHQRHAILYPPRQSPDMQELKNQRNEMANVNGSYKRVRNRHDDLFMSKLIGCNAIRLFWDNQKHL